MADPCVAVTLVYMAKHFGMACSVLRLVSERD